MSSIPTKQIDGDVAVGRNVTVGGKTTVRGSATIGHNLIVKGWLDAPNVKGPDKGLFKTAAQLREAYPNPHEGWWALVGDTLPAQVYMADGGFWVAQTNADGTPRLAGNPTVDVSEFMEAVNAMAEELDDIKKTAGAGVAAAEKAQSGVNAINEKRGKADGFAPLDGSGRISMAHIPDELKNVVEFSGFTDEIPEVLSQIYNGNGRVVYCKETKKFLFASDTTPVKYYDNWSLSAIFGAHASGGVNPVARKIYIDILADKQYYWDGSELKTALQLGHEEGTAYPGDEGARLSAGLRDVSKDIFNNKRLIENVGILPFDGVWNGIGSEPLAGVWLCPGPEGGWYFRSFGESGFGPQYVSEDYNSDVRAKSEKFYRCGNVLYRVSDDKIERFVTEGSLNEKIEEALEPRTFINANALLGSSVPYTLAEVLQLLETQYGTLFNIPGLVLTYRSQDGWESRQWSGRGSFTDEGTWSEFGANGYGNVSHTGNTVNVNDVCVDDEYTLSTAIKAVQDKEAESGVKYFRSGVVLTFKTAGKDSKGAPVWEAYQFTREITDIDPADLKPWVPFGGGGSQAEVETKEDPMSGGKDAFSTGGAYRHIPTRYRVTQDEGTVTIQPLNEGGEEIGEAITFFASQGGGGELSGTIVNIKFKDSPLYGAVGKDIIGYACIRSVTQAGSIESVNSIVSLKLIDRDTNVVIREWTVNTRSSDDEEYNFEIPFTGMFDGAGSRRFRLEATDDTDHTGYRFITVTAVDATVESTQVLNYTSDYAIPYGGTRVINVPLYKFPQNVSEKGIQAFIEIWWEGAWRPLTATPPTHFDAYSNSAPFNPMNLFGGGEKMQHGAYPVRIHGRDVASGVTGNTIYTAVMCIDANSSVPVVALRYNDTGDGTVRLHDRVKVEVAAYNPNPLILTTNVALKADDRILGRYELGANQIETAEMQVSGYRSDGSDKINITAEAYDGDTVLATSGTVCLTVKGSAIDAALMDGALYHFDFSSRSNSEPTHEIEDGDYRIELQGANWSSNGFVNYLGQIALRTAENVTGELNHAPFSSRTIEETGMAFQMMFATNNIKDSEAMLLDCVDSDNGAGFYIKGNKVGLQCKTGSPALIERRFSCGEIHTVAFVVEPAATAISRNGTKWATMRMYLDGELVGAIGYNPEGSRLLNMKNVMLNGTRGDLYLYYILSYQSYYDWSQAFRNYVVKQSDTDAMIEEFNRENVLVSQNAEGSTSMRPSAPLLFAQGMPYCIFVADDSVHNQFDFGKGVDDDGTSTSDKFKMTVYYYHPTMPWRSFKAIDCEIRRQGTTSAKRPKKNYRIYIKKATEVIPLYPDYTNEDALTSYALFAMKKVRVTENSIPVDVITIKVDFSNSGGANDCSVCDMVNATYRALGEDFLTPAQRCYDGTWDKGDVHLSGLQMNHSTANHPIAVFRSNSDTLQNVWFEAKGNWKEDKGEQVALGFKDVPGYNKGCLNFQDEVFNWVCGNPGETLDQMEARFKTMEGLDTGMPYLLYPYCSRNYRFMRYQGGVWKNTTGSWIWTGPKTRTITGDVLNPVGGFELLTYEGFDWWQGVSSVEDMMKPSKNIAKWVQKLIDKSSSGVSGEEFPAWTYYFECMVDNDALQADLAMGRIVPFELYVQLRLCDYCDYAKYPEEWVERWRNNAYKFRNVRADMVYLADADYQNEFDSLSKNHQPMHFLLEGHNVVNGVYDSEKDGATSPTGFNCDFVLTRQPIVQNANKKYDIDGAYESDNDGGNTGQPEADPTRPSDEASGYVNPWAGWGAVPWRGYFTAKTIKADDNGGEIEYQKTVAAMRAVQTVLPDGRTINPFSPEGAKYYFINQHLEKWPKVVSSYDGIRKYIQYTATSDALYFYALQGLGLASLPQFIEQRWRFRDGYYKTGGFFTGVLSGRIACGGSAAIRIVAAKSGYFGMGNDSSGSLSADGAVYLDEGDEYVFTNFSHQQGALLYIYQADRIREIEFTDVSLSDNFDFSVMKLAEKIIVGGANYKQYAIGYNPLTQFSLSELPFLKVLDIRNTPAMSVDASKCPRLEQLLAGGTQLSEFQLAETSPVDKLQLPDTVTRLDLVNLPNLTYPGGLEINDFSNIRRLMTIGCEKIDAIGLAKDILNTARLRYIRLPNLHVTGNSAILRQLIQNGTIGLAPNGEAYDESGYCSGLSGRWIMEDYVETNELASFRAYFPQLEIHNSQFSTIVFSDDDDDPENISNVENKTGFKYSTDASFIPYVPSGHVVKIRDSSPVCAAIYDSGVMKIRPLHIDSLLKYSNGEDFDPKDSQGLGYDVMKYIPRYWYKGVNHFAASEKYLFVSSNEEKPLSTATRVERHKVEDLLLQREMALLKSEQAIGSVPISSSNTSTNIYKTEVRGMKLLRYPGMNVAQIAVLFTDGNERVIGVFSYYNPLSDMAVGDYIIAEIPEDAVYAFITIPKGLDETEVVITDSANVESVEPDWLVHEPELIGVYRGCCDGGRQLRSISGAVATHGNNVSSTNADWEYDGDGNLSSIVSPTSAMNWTIKDLSNAAAIRGRGYQLQDYESWKDFAVMVMAITGTRDLQARCGLGTQGEGTAASGGYDTLNPHGFSVYPSALGSPPKGNLLWGVQNYMGCGMEALDNVAVNINSWKLFKRNRCVEKPDDPIDNKWHVYNPNTKEVRIIQAVETGNTYCIGKVRWGKNCDIVCSQTTSDKSAFNRHFTDAYEFDRSKGRIPCHSYPYQQRNAGIVYANATYPSYQAYRILGGRLCFRGTIIFAS